MVWSAVKAVRSKDRLDSSAVGSPASVRNMLW